jgi:hypothetical protein
MKKREYFSPEIKPESKIEKEKQEDLEIKKSKIEQELKKKKDFNEIKEKNPELIEIATTIGLSKEDQKEEIEFLRKERKRFQRERETEKAEELNLLIMAIRAHFLTLKEPESLSEEKEVFKKIIDDKETTELYLDILEKKYKVNEFKEEKNTVKGILARHYREVKDRYNFLEMYFKEK